MFHDVYALNLRETMSNKASFKAKPRLDQNDICAFKAKYKKQPRFHWNDVFLEKPLYKKQQIDQEGRLTNIQVSWIAARQLQRNNTRKKQHSDWLTTYKKQKRSTICTYSYTSKSLVGEIVDHLFCQTNTESPQPADRNEGPEQTAFSFSAVLW